MFPNGWQAIKTYLEFTDSLTEFYHQLDTLLATFPGSVEVTGENSLRRLHISSECDLGPAPGYDPETVVPNTQRAAVADALSAAGSLWSWALTNVTTKGQGHPERPA